MSTGRTPLGTRHAPPPVSWRSWPLAEGGRRAWSMLVVVVIGALLVGWVMRSLPWGALAGVLLAAGMWRFFMPVVYELSALGVTQHFWRGQQRIPWAAVERCEECRDGIYLSSPGAPLAHLRGLYIPWGDHREEVLALVRYYLPQTVTNV